MNQTLIVEKRSNIEVYYKRTNELFDGEKVTSIVRTQTVILNYKDEEYFILYDSYTNVDRGMFRYLNYGDTQSTAEKQFNKV